LLDASDGVIVATNCRGELAWISQEL
jgi:hypothetical protein